MDVRKITLIAAAAFALGTGLLLLLFMHGSRSAAQSASGNATVLVAAQPIPKGIILTPAMFAVQMRSKDAVDPDAVTDAHQLNGQVSLIAMPAGSTLTLSKIGTMQDTGLSVQLKPGERAVSISVDRVKNVSGLLNPGDRVDVLAEGPKIDNHVQPAKIILRGITVLAIGDSTQSTGASPSPDNENAATVTLAVTPVQADVLFTADENAVLRLALRSPREAVYPSAPQTITYDSSNDTQGVPVAGAPPAQPQPVAAAVQPVARAAQPLQPSQSQSNGGADPNTVNGVSVIQGTP